MPEACDMLKARTPEIDVLKELIEKTGFTDFSFTKDNEPLQGDKSVIHLLLDLVHPLTMLQFINDA